MLNVQVRVDAEMLVLRPRRAAVLPLPAGRGRALPSARRGPGQRPLPAGRAARRALQLVSPPCGFSVLLIPRVARQFSCTSLTSVQCNDPLQCATGKFRVVCTFCRFVLGAFQNRSYDDTRRYTQSSNTNLLRIKLSGTCSDIDVFFPTQEIYERVSKEQHLSSPFFSRMFLSQLFARHDIQIFLTFRSVWK